MQLIVDLHIHSRYANATSKYLTIKEIYKWCKIKGINIVGTGDFTHPAWFDELNTHLEPAEPGLYKLKDKFAKEIDAELPESVSNTLSRFILTVEISNIYTKGGRGRRLHNVVIVPSFEVAAKLNSQLDKIGNLKADGRPILGMNSKDLLKMTLDSDSESLFIPAHIWTPWYAMFGSKSGFDTIEECFDELAPEIKAVETGLSSDPFMNWRLSALDNITLVSNSDAHSVEKLAREANIIETQKLTYAEIINAIKTGDKRFVGTIEFFPQEGMYHFDGHRACDVKFSPKETKEHKGLCPVCGGKLVVGVQYRVNELADRPFEFKPKTHKKVEYIVPLVEIIKEIKGIKSIKAKTVVNQYTKMYQKLGTEFDILRNINLKTIHDAGFIAEARAIQKMRKGDVFIDPGYDGVYGTVQIFKPDEKQNLKNQLNLL